jgi:hypothetical protein
MTFRGFCLFLAAFAACQPLQVRAQETLTEEQLRRAYERAMQNFGRADAPAQEPTAPTQPAQQQPDAPQQQPQQDAAAEQPARPGGEVRIGVPDRRPAVGKVADVPLEPIALHDLRISIDVENIPLEDVMRMIVEQAESSTGRWGVRWRLKDENRSLINERVNLTAETHFGQFVSYMVDHINNLTGTRLFVRVFDDARLIIITDTY